MKLGVDVSYAQGQINWDVLKKNADFAIIRCGYGDDIASQDDNWWTRNVTEAERVDIPYGVYLYSYIDSETHLQSEIAHTLRLINGHKPFCVYLDLEGNIFKQGKASLTAYAKRWCEAIQNAGYKAGVYASGSWFDNYIDIYTLYNAGYSIWVAQYGPQPHWDGINYDLWQFTSNGTVKGIDGRVDLNRLYNDNLIEQYNIRGFLDDADINGCRGWAYNGVNDVPVSVHIYAYKDGGAEGSFLCATEANEYREDLEKAKIGNGYHGFNAQYNLIELGEGTYTIKGYAVIGNNVKQLNREFAITVTQEDIENAKPTLPPEEDPQISLPQENPQENSGSNNEENEENGSSILAALKHLLRLILEWIKS